MDVPLNTDFVSWLEWGGALRLGITKDLDIAKTDPVRGSLALPDTLDVQVIQAVIVQLNEGREGTLPHFGFQLGHTHLNYFADVTTFDLFILLLALD